MDGIEALAAWLEATPVATSLRASTWVYPLVNAVHLTGLALLIGAIAALDLRLLGWRRDAALASLAAVLLPLARIGFALAVATGSLLFAVRAVDYVQHPVFRLRLALLLVALGNVAWLHASGRWRAALAAGRAGAGAHTGGVVSLLAWLGVLIAGRMIGYR